jgi:dTDP-D-glucose 4,6-dehydratase
MAKSENSNSVTEAAGFLGSRSVRAILAETGDRLVALDALTYTGNRPNVTDLEEALVIVSKPDA